MITFGKAWSNKELEILRNNRHLTVRQILKLLPGRTFAAVESRRRKTRWLYIPPPPKHPSRRRTEGPRKLKRVGHPLIDAVITRCEEDRIGLRNLDREIGSGHYFSKKYKTFSLEPIAKAIAFFGGRGLMVDEDANVTIDWNDI